MDQPLIDFVEWSVNLAFWASVAFPFVIAVIWPWWKDWFGQTMVAVDTCFAGAALGLVLRYDWGVKSVSLAWADAIALSLSFLVIVWRTVMIFRQQRVREVPASDDPAGPGSTEPVPAPERG